MKRLLIITVFFLLVVGLAVWLWPSKPMAPTPANETVKSSQSQAIEPSQYSGESNALAQLPAVDPEKYDPTLPQWQEWRRRNKEDGHWEWKMPINFYGKVVEYTTGQPISEVEIVLTWTDLSPEGSSKRMAYSDAKGNFSLTDVTGKVLVVTELKKEGYIRSNVGSQFGFEYAAFFDKNYHQPDPENPVIFRMKKKDVAEPLIHRDTLYGLKPDGIPHYLDLKTGRKTVGGAPTGDLMLQLTRSASSNPDRPNWILTIQGVSNVGLIESPEEFMFEAPASGYVNQIRVAQQGDGSDYQSQIYKNYYVKLADGTFARIETHIFSKYNDEAAINVGLYLNPTPGNRNLEYDPNKQVNP
jgi:hypothetical protein